MSNVGQKMIMTDLKMNSGNLDGFYRGVVEDNKDPDGVGRCRVRILGVHSDNKGEQTDDDGIPTDQLPWANQVTGLSGNAASSIPQIGAYVFVFFENGNLMQPRYFGIVPGTEKGNKSAPDPNVNMTTPDGTTQATPDTVDTNCDYIAYLVRTVSDDTGTKGTFTIKTVPKDGTQGLTVFTGATLELPWRNNLGGKSCFPKGTYKCVYTASAGKPALTKTYIINGTPGRAGCRIHKWNWAGNKDLGYRADVEGCVLLGSSVTDNADNARGKRQRRCEGSEAKVRDLAITLREKSFTLVVSGVVG